MQSSFSVLELHGCPTMQNGASRVLCKNGERPYLAIVQNSLPPTKEEIEVLSQCITKLRANHGGKAGSDRAPDARTFVVNKVPNGWHGYYLGGNLKVSPTIADLVSQL